MPKTSSDFDKFIYPAGGTGRRPREDRKGILIAKFLDFVINENGTEEKFRDLNQRTVDDVLKDIRDSTEEYDAIKKLLSDWDVKI